MLREREREAKKLEGTLHFFEKLSIPLSIKIRTLRVQILILSGIDNEAEPEKVVKSSKSPIQYFIRWIAKTFVY